MKEQQIIYLNCRKKGTTNTEYRIIAHIARQLGADIPQKGLPTDEVYNIFFNSLKKTDKKNIIIVLDEINQLKKKTGKEIMRNLALTDLEMPDKNIVAVGV